jgi:hypothetical protein
MMMFPTPTVQDSKNNGSSSQMQRNTKPLNAEVGGKLNPDWVELLMGWPKSWTCIDPISRVCYCQWIMENSYDQKTRAEEAMRLLRSGFMSEELSRQIGRPIGIHEAAILLAVLCEHKNRPDQARVFVACSEALEKEVRGVRTYTRTSCSSYKPEHTGQPTGEHSDTMQALSRLLAYFGKEAWKNGSWENAVPRVACTTANRVDRLKAIGNGQVPQVAALAWRILTGEVQS